MVTEKKRQKEEKHPKKNIPQYFISEERKKEFNILLAEDEIINQTVVKIILERLGYSVDIFSNGKDAVEALKQTPYDLVLMDCEMPEMDGYEATGEIRDPDSKVLDHEVPVIALTGHAIDGDIRRFTDAGMDDFLSKPVKPAKLSCIIEKWLSKERSPRNNNTLPRLAGTEKNVKQVIDLSVLMENLSDDRDLVFNILDDFLEYIPIKISDLKKAFDNGEASSVRHEAHRIKGLTANIGAESLNRIAHQIEIAGESGNLTGVDSLLSQFDEQLGLFKKGIAKLDK